MGVDKEVKVSTVDVESGDNMATLPASSRSHQSSEAEKLVALKEMEIRNVVPKPLERLNPMLLTLNSFVCHTNHTAPVKNYTNALFAHQTLIRCIY